jgi:hypothetical protein
VGYIFLPPPSAGVGLSDIWKSTSSIIAFSRSVDDFRAPREASRPKAGLTYSLGTQVILPAWLWTTTISPDARDTTNHPLCHRLSEWWYTWMCWPTRSGAFEPSLCRFLLGISPSSSASSSALFKCLRILKQDYPKPWLILVSKSDRQTVVRRTDRNKKASADPTLAPLLAFKLEVQAQDKLNLAVGSRAHSPGHSLVKLPEAATSARRGS